MSAQRVAVDEQRCPGCRSITDDPMCARCRDFVETLPPGFVIGAHVRISGEQGTFRVTGFARDGSLSLYGGTSGHGGSRSVFVKRLRLIKRAADDD